MAGKCLQKLYMYKFIRGFLILTCLTGAGRTTVAASDAAGSERIVVMISVDGLAAYYLDDPKAEMPTLRKLAA